jgi:cysteine sulfinate desulfinase/cysteine desulfurase-like protein
MMDAQLVTGATQDRRIFTGSAACAALAPMSAAARLANSNFEKRMGFLLRADFAAFG